MAPQSLLTSYIYVDGWDAGGDSKSLSLDGTRTDLDRSTFRSGGWQEFAKGARAMELGYDGWSHANGAGTPDHELFENLGVSRVITVGLSETEGTVAQMMRASSSNIEFFGQYNTLNPFSLRGANADGRDGVVRGRLVKAKGSVNATGATGAEVELGAVGASEFLYATFHVFTAGTTITAVLESDSDDTFGSATTRVTFGPITTVGGTWAARVAGPITDSWYRLRITTITGTFSIACAAGIQV